MEIKLAKDFILSSTKKKLNKKKIKKIKWIKWYITIDNKFVVSAWLNTWYAAAEIYNKLSSENSFTIF